MKLSRRRALAALASVALPGCAGEAAGGLTSGGAAARSGASASAAASGAGPDPLARLREARERLRPLHEKTGIPRRGEWRFEHPEPGQTFEQYLAAKPTLPTPERRTLVIQPLGDFDRARAAILDRTIDYMGRYFGLPTRREPALPLSAVAREAQRVHPSWGDHQLNSAWILHKLLEPRLPGDAAALIAFTPSDLWPEDGWNFVFGEADLKKRVGVWSVYRHGDPSRGAEARKLALLRALKVAVHETGHMFSLEHCTAYRCVQAGINSLEEDDKAPLWLCPECVTKIAWATGVDPAARYGKLEAFCREAGLDEEARFFARSIAALG